MRLLVAGSAIVDLTIRPTSSVDRDASNEADIRWGAGGAGRNVAENLARLGARVTLATDLGPDPFGAFLLEHAGRLGLEVRLARRERTGLYLALLEPGGALDRGFCRTGTEAVTPEELLGVLPDLEAFQGVVIDANLSAPAVEALARRCREAGVPYALEPAARERAARVAGALAGAFLVKPDRGEAEVLTGCPCREAGEAARCARILRERGARHVIVSLGPEGFHVDFPGFAGLVPPEPTRLVDVTGAGDALLAAAFLGLLRGLPGTAVLRAAARAAALACASPAATSDRLSPDLYEENPCT